jgi:hypothetical protein
MPPSARLPRPYRELAAWHATALAERTRHDGHPDPAAWAAVAAWERLGQPHRLADACFRQAEALLAAAGDRKAAAEALRRAAALTGRLGARPLDTEIKGLARRARLDLAPHDAVTAPGGRRANARRTARPDAARGRGARDGRGWAQ